MSYNFASEQPPPPEFLAEFVRITRRITGWKQAALAFRAGVSVSTVQRVERGETVSPEILEKIGQALGQEPGAMTTPRRPLTDDEVGAAIAQKYAWLSTMTQVDVGPLRTHRQLRALSISVLCMTDDDLPPEAADELAGFREWLDLMSFIRAEADGFIGGGDKVPKLRRIADDVLAAAHNIERVHKAVCLVGTYVPEHQVASMQGAEVGLVAFRSRINDPAAAGRRFLLAPRAIDMAEALRKAFDEDGL
jgi:transcriptional regulator with XRE-family HTH domain